MKNASKKNSPAQVIFGLLLICAILFFLYKLMRVLWDAFSQVNPTVGAGIVAATATVIVSVISVLFAKRLEQRSLLLKEHRDRKTPIYEEIVGLVFSMAFSEKTGRKPLSEKELIEKMAWITEHLVVWGSDELLLSWSNFRSYSIRNADNSGPQILFEVEKLLLSIRKDLGHENKGVVRGKILALFINDIDDYLQDRSKFS